MSKSLYNAAIDFYQAGQLDQAANHLQQCLETHPNHADSLHLLGIVYYQSEQPAKSVAFIQQALAIEPRNINFLNNYGLTLKANGQLDDALSAYQKALSLNPKDLDVQLNIANLMMALTRFEEAAGFYRRLLRIYKAYQPEHQQVIAALSHALSQLGNQAARAGNHIQAEACFAEAVQFNDRDSSLFYNLANAERELGKTQQAAQHFQAAIALTPNDADAYNNLGNVQRELGLLDAAIKSYESALLINPNLHHAKVHLVHQKQHTCDWDGLTQAIQTVKEWVNNAPSAQVSPFAFLAMPSTSASAQLTCANHWIENRFKALIEMRKTLTFEPAKTKGKKLKVGYLSADFRLHPLAFLITELIELHDRSTFDIVGYSFGMDDQSTARKLLVNAFDQFNDIQHLSEIDAAKKIHADGIDILVDLTGFTQTSRSGIMALRPARIHMSWLGFAGTMGYLAEGEPLFDYLLTDDYITPESSAGHYAEKLAYLPCYQPNDRKRPIGKQPTRAMCQLPDDAFVFCSFNQSFKITSEIFAAWLRILKSTPNSVLWLLDCNATATNNLINIAAEQSIGEDRIIFAPRVAIADHLARHSHADLFLDTQPYNAHTTCSDALWMDVPVLTIEGDTFASRVAGSLLMAVGLSDLITPSITAYEAKAISYGKNPESLKAVTDRLRASKAHSILFDTPAFTSALESVYQQVWQQDGV